MDNSSITKDINDVLSVKDGGITGNKLSQGIVNSDDLSLVNNKIQLSNRGTTNGMGYIILRKDLPFDSQLTQQNTIYVIRYNFILASDVTIPANCVLEFEGGSLSGSYTITGNNTGIIAPLTKIFNPNVLFDGMWNIKEAYPEWFGAKGDGTTDDTTAIQKTAVFKSIKLQAKTYLASNLIFGSHIALVGTEKKTILQQKDNSSGDFITFENWDYGEFRDIYVKGGTNIAEVNYEQALVKVRTTTAYQVTEGHYLEWPTHEGSSWNSVIENIVIQLSEYNGLSLLTNGVSDNGVECWHNWIINTSNLWINNCKRYCIFNMTTDNRFSNIQLSYGMLADLYDKGSACIWSNMKIDGQGGLNALAKVKQDYSFQTEEEYYAKLMEVNYGANVILDTCYINNYINIDIQSSAYTGVKFIGNCMDCTFIGRMDNCSTESPYEYKKYTPALYIKDSGYLKLDIAFNIGVGYKQAQLIRSAGSVFGSIINLTADSLHDSFFGETVNDIKKLQKTNIVKVGNYSCLSGNYPVNTLLRTRSTGWYTNSYSTDGTRVNDVLFSGEPGVLFKYTGGARICEMYNYNGANTDISYKKNHVYLAVCIATFSDVEHINGSPNAEAGPYFNPYIYLRDGNRYIFPTLNRMVVSNSNKLHQNEKFFVSAMFTFDQDIDYVTHDFDHLHYLSLLCINPNITVKVSNVNLYDLTQELGAYDLVADVNGFVDYLFSEYGTDNPFRDATVGVDRKTNIISGIDNSYKSLYDINGEMYYNENLKKPYYNLNGKMLDANGFSVAANKGTIRPTLTSSDIGFCFFDTNSNVNKPIWYDGNQTTGWCDATGNPV